VPMVGAGPIQQRQAMTERRDSRRGRGREERGERREGKRERGKELGSSVQLQGLGSRMVWSQLSFSLL